MNRKISVRRIGVCSLCGAEIAIGSQAMWDQSNRILTCLSHPDSEHSILSEEPKTQKTGIAGGSAKVMSQKFRERDEMRAKRNQERFESSHPFISKYITPKAKVSHQTKVWSKGAEGEVQVGKILDDLAEKYGFLSIHDRLIPRSKANIDHMAITSSGIFIVDAKNYEGTIEVRGRLEKYVGGNSQLWIGKRNRTNLIDGVNKQILAVEKVLEEGGIKFPVFGALAFYRARWDLPAFLRANSVNGVLINSRGLEHIFEKLTPSETHQITEIAELLLSKLRSAT